MGKDNVMWDVWVSYMIPLAMVCATAIICAYLLG